MAAWLSIAALLAALTALGISLFGPNSSARVDVLERRLAARGAELDDLAARLDMITAELERRGTTPEQGEDTNWREGSADAPIDLGDYGDLMQIVNRSGADGDVEPVTTARLKEVFGLPTTEPGTDCGEPTSPLLRAALETRNVGPFRARMIRPALDSLEKIFAEVRDSDRELYGLLTSHGSLCVRLIRGSEDMLSRHAWGAAIDVSIGDTLDVFGDGKTQMGLILLAEHFKKAGWVWGAAWGREDSMHFEVGAELFDSWYPP